MFLFTFTFLLNVSLILKFYPFKVIRVVNIVPFIIIFFLKEFFITFHVLIRISKMVILSVNTVTSLRQVLHSWLILPFPKYTGLTHFIQLFNSSIISLLPYFILVLHMKKSSIYHLITLFFVPLARPFGLISNYIIATN